MIKLIKQLCQRKFRENHHSLKIRATMIPYFEQLVLHQPVIWRIIFKNRHIGLFMNDKLRRIFGQGLITFIPFIVLGTLIACMVGLFVLSWYLLLSGFIIGSFLWLVAWLRRFFLKKKPITHSQKGRIIDHDTNQSE